MATNDDIEIRVKVDAAGALTILDKLGNEVQTVGGKAEDTAGSFSSLQKSIITINQAAQLASAAFNLASKAGSELISAIKQGSAIDDVAQSFTSMAAAAGGVSEVFLGQLQQATASTISNFELMQKANEAMRAGIKPDEFVELTETARVLAEQVGGNLTDELDALSRAFATGQARSLGMRLDTIDTTAAEKKLAESLGVTSEQLSKEGKIQAARTAIMEASIQRQKEFGEVGIDSGDAIDIFSTALTNARDEAFKAIGTNADLNTALLDMAKFVKAIDWKPFIEGIGEAIRLAGEFLGAAKAIAEVPLGWLEKLAFSPVGDAIDGLLNDLAGVAPEATKTGVAVEKAADKTTAAMKDLAKVAPPVLNKVNEASKLIAKDGFKKASDEARKLRDLLNSSEGYSQYQGKINGVLAAHKKGIVRANELRTELSKLEKEFVKGGGSAARFSEIVEKSLSTELDANAEAARAAAKAIADYAKEQKDAADESRKLASEARFKTTFGVDKSTASGFAQGLFGTGFSEETEAEANAAIAASLGNAVAETANALKDGKIAKEEIAGLASAAGAVIGGAIGAAYSGGAGAAGGAAAGSAIGGMMAEFAELLNKPSASETARKAADEFFADLFDANRVSAVINGQLALIQDLVFQGDTPFGQDLVFGGTGFNDHGIGSEHLAQEPLGTAYEAGVNEIFGSDKIEGNDPFAGLAASSDEVLLAFNGIGNAFDGLLASGENAGQLAAVLFNNIGGDLNNLQLLVEATGVSFADLSAAIITSFKNGELSVIEAQQSLMELQSIMTDGIPGAVGAVNEAFNNFLIASQDGVQGSALLLDSIQDLAFEAQDLGITTFPQLADVLINTFGAGKEQVDQLMQALVASGITSLDILRQASEATLISVGANVEAIKNGEAPTYKPITTDPTIPAARPAGGGRSSGGGAKKESAKQKAEREKLAALQALNRVILDNVRSTRAYEDGLNKADFEKLYSEIATKTKELTNAEKALAQVQDKKIKSVDALFRAEQRLKDARKALEEITDAQQPAIQSYKDLEDAALKAFLTGQKTAKETVETLQAGIGNGIGGLEGGYVQAIKNLMTAGKNGGAFSLDAFKDIFAEAKEAGVSDLGTLQELILQSGEFAATDVAAIFKTLFDQNVRSVDEALKLTNAQVVEAIAGLEDMNFPLMETTDHLRNILGELERLSLSEIDVRINVHTALDPNGQALFDAVGAVLPVAETPTPGNGQANRALTAAERKRYDKYLRGKGGKKAAERYRDSILAKAA